MNYEDRREEEARIKRESARKLRALSLVIRDTLDGDEGALAWALELDQIASDLEAVALAGSAGSEETR